jgi:hypothetical protein
MFTLQFQKLTKYAFLNVFFLFSFSGFFSLESTQFALSRWFERQVMFFRIVGCFWNGQLGVQYSCNGVK